MTETGHPKLESLNLNIVIEEPYYPVGVYVSRGVQVACVE
jgi:hypothetical protein